MLNLRRRDFVSLLGGAARGRSRRARSSRSCRWSDFFTKDSRSRCRRGMRFAKVVSEAGLIESGGVSN